MPGSPRATPDGARRGNGRCEPVPVGDAVVMKCTQSTAGHAAELERVADRQRRFVDLDLRLNDGAANGP
jgi:hypothetical protein